MNLHAPMSQEGEPIVEFLDGGERASRGLYPVRKHDIKKRLAVDVTLED